MSQIRYTAQFQKKTKLFFTTYCYAKVQKANKTESCFVGADFNKTFSILTKSTAIEQFFILQHFSGNMKI